MQRVVLTTVLALGVAALPAAQPPAIPAFRPGDLAAGDAGLVMLVRTGLVRKAIMAGTLSPADHAEAMGERDAR